MPAELRAGPPRSRPAGCPDGVVLGLESSSLPYRNMYPLFLLFLATRCVKIAPNNLSIFNKSRLPGIPENNKTGETTKELQPALTKDRESATNLG